MPQIKARRTKFLITGANGRLGQTISHLLGPELAILGTRSESFGDSSFLHICVAGVEKINKINWENVYAVINVAGRVKGARSDLFNANVEFPIALATSARAGGVSQFVQVSSFSVYGIAEQINANTNEAPINDYGRTKAGGDIQLMKIATANFRVASLRLPFLFDEAWPGLLGPLFKFIRVSRLFPISYDMTKRSMISYSDAAQALFQIAQQGRSGILHAAAPTVFDFEMLDKLIRNESNFHFCTIRLPSVVIKLIEVVAPKMHRRLFKSNVLDAEANIAIGISPIIDLTTPIKALIRSHFT